jgi:drug/metabolite transporter (DMT)-like permease
MEPTRSNRYPSSGNHLALAYSLTGIWIIWGLSYLFTRIALREWPAYTMVMTRFVLAGLLLLALARTRRERWPTKREFRNAIILAFFLICAGTASTMLGQNYNTAAVASTIASSSSVWIALFSALNGRRIRPLEWLGTALGVPGIVLLGINGEWGTNALGFSLGLVGTLAWSVGTALSQRLEQVPGSMRTAVQMLAGGVMMLPMILVRGEPVPQTISMQSALALGALVSGAIWGFTGYAWLLAREKIALATGYAYINPVVAIVAGTLVLGEPFNLANLPGMAVILLGVVCIWITNLTRDAPAQSDPQSHQSAQTPESDTRRQAKV